MAPRRLLAFVLGFLLLSSLATLLIGSPSQKQRDTTPPKTDARRPVAAPPVNGKLLNETVKAGSAKRPVIKATVGDQLALRVTGQRSETVELAGLGEVADVNPGTPATFNVLLSQTGSYEIRMLGSKQPIGTIRVTEANAKPRPRSSRARRSRSSGAGSASV